MACVSKLNKTTLLSSSEISSFFDDGPMAIKSTSCRTESHDKNQRENNNNNYFVIPKKMVQNKTITLTDSQIWETANTKPHFSVKKIPMVCKIG